MGKNNKMAKEPRRNLESALERLRREDRLRRSTKGSPLYNIAQTLTELDTEKEKVPQTISLEAALKSTYMVPTSIAFGLLHGLGKIGGNFASFVGALDQEYVDTLSKSVSGKFLKFASEQAPEKDAGGRRLMETIGKLGTAGGEMVSYAVPAIGFARIFQVALGFRPLVATATADALVGFGGMSPDEENFFNFVEDISKENNLEALETLGRILATNPNNTEFENRVNNGIETLIALGLSESAVRGIIKLNTMRKMAFAKAKGEDTANKYEAVKEKLSPEINKELDKAVEPKPTDEEPLGTPVTEAEKLPVDKQTELALKAPDIEENLLKSIQENKPPEIEDPFDDELSELAKELGEQDKSNVPESILKAVDSVKPITPEEFLEKYKTKPEDAQDAFPFKGVPSASDEIEFLKAVKNAKTPDNYKDLFNVLEEEESFVLKGNLLASTEQIDKKFASNYLTYLQNKNIDKYMVEANEMADTLKINKTTLNDHPILETSSMSPDPEFEKKFQDTATVLDDLKKTKDSDMVQFEEFETIGPKPGGSADGAKIKDKATGIEYIAKYYDNPEQAAQEAITAKAYQITGTKTPDVKVIHANIDGKGKVFILSEFIEDIEPYKVDFVDPEDMGRIHVAAAIMKDWDAIGLAKDNVAFGKKLGTGKAQLIQLDAGGSGAFRAMGGYKPNSTSFFDVPSNSIEDWSSLVSEKNEAARSVLMDAYNKNPIAYMQGVKKALAQFRMNQEELLDTVERATKAVGMNADDAVDNFINTYGSRWGNISKSLQDSIDVHDAVAVKPTPINEKDLQELTFSPSGDGPNKINEPLQILLAKYRSTPEYKAQKQGFDPTGGFQRFSQGELTFQQPYPSLIQGTTLTPSAYYKAKAAGASSEEILGKELSEAIEQGEIPFSQEIVKQKKKWGIGKEQTDEELSAPTNLPLGTTPLPSYTRKQAVAVDKVLKKKGVKEKVKFMLDPFGSNNWTFKQLPDGVNYKKVEGVSQYSSVGPIYGGDMNQNAFVYDKPLYNNAYVFEDGVSSSNYIITGKKKLYQGTMAGATSAPPKGAIPLQFLTLGKSLSMHVPPVVEGFVLPQNPNIKELLETYINVKDSVIKYTKGDVDNQNIDVVLGYVDLIFSNAYGNTAFKAAKESYNLTASLAFKPDGKASLIFNNLSEYQFAEGIEKTTRFKKFTYAPNTPQGRAEYQKEFGNKWAKEAAFDDTNISSWKDTEASGGYISRFLLRINEQANEVGDVFLTIPVNDEMKNVFTAQGKAKDKVVRQPFSQATLPPVLAKQVVKGSSKKIKDIFKVGKPNEYITTLKAITFDPKDPTKISKELSAKFSTLNDTNVLASYIGPVATITSINQFIPKDTKETIEIESDEVEQDAELVPLDQGESIREELPQTELDTTPITREATEKSTSSTLEDGTVVLHPTIYKDKKTNIPQELSGQDAMIAAMDFEARNPNLEFPRFDTVEEADQYSRDRSEAGGASEMPLYLDTTEEELDIDSQMSDLNLGEQSNDELRQTL